MWPLTVALNEAFESGSYRSEGKKMKLELA